MSGLSSPEYLVELASRPIESVIYYTTPAKSVASAFSPALSKTSNAIQLIDQNDPFGTIADTVKEDKLATIFTNELTLINALPHLYSLKNNAAVIVVELRTNNYGVITALKDLGYFTFISNSPSDVADFGACAYKAASELLQPVFHFVNPTPGPVHGSINLNEITLLEEPTEDSTSILENVNKLAYYGNAKDPQNLVINLSALATRFQRILPGDTALLEINVYRPWDIKEVFEYVRSSVRKIVIVQGASAPPYFNLFDPILLDFFADFNLLIERNIDQLIVTHVGEIADEKDALDKILDNLRSKNPDKALFVGKTTLDSAVDSEVKKSIKKAFSHEEAYLKVLKQVFASHVQIFNQFKDEKIITSRPEYGFGKFIRQQEKRDALLALAKKSLDPAVFNAVEADDIVAHLKKWIDSNERSLDEVQLDEANEVASELYGLLQRNQDSETALKLLELAPSSDAFKINSNWLIGSDSWSYDLGNSGVHQLLASRRDINVLLIDSQPQEKVKTLAASSISKKDVGLYALNFGNAYVASVAVYSSYTQLLSALIEASKFKGPSLVVAYLPTRSENDSILDILKETKSAVESGFWPLYRFNPLLDERDSFKLDSSVIRRQLQEFLDKENRLTLLAKASPTLAQNLEYSASGVVELKQRRRAKAAYNQLLEGLSGPPIHIYFASDGGTASGLARRLGSRAQARGLKVTVLSMDDIELDELAGEENVIFVTSTAGQGEFPQDGKAFWDALKASNDLDLASLNFGVFGLGDSLYWPRKEDKHYFNKPSQDLFKKLELLSARAIVPLGLGDDQDADGHQTAYGEWEKQLWEALGVSGAAVPDEPKPLTNEDMKIASNFLRGTIAGGLKDDTTGAISAADQQLTKFHGIYMQDDRDIRETRKAQGLEPYYMFMTRIRLPGGKATPEQWLILDHLADKTGNGTIKITTRATFQLHGIVKRNLKHTIRAMNSTLMDTLAACGDVNRNVMVSALPANAKVHDQVSEIGAKISEYLLPRTTAYHEIWLEGPDDRDQDPNWRSIFENREGGPIKKKTLVGGNALVDVEPLYGPTYLPRKFKINITVPPYNDVDVFSIDVGLVAIVNEKSQIVEGFNMFVGGGMGATHNNKKTYPRTGSGFGFVKADEVHVAIENVMLVQRDHGDRQNRKHARLKYTIDDMGVEVYKQKVEELWGKKFEPERPYKITSNTDYFGWVKDERGFNHFTTFIENGRVENTPDLPHKTGLKKIAQYMQKTGSGHFRLTGNQHVLISGIENQHLAEIKDLLKTYKLDNTDFSGLRLSSAACVALPTCGLAMAESERYLPFLISKLEDALEQYGLRHDSVVMRMTGCPNGCSRPWLAEVACVGKAPGTYNLMLGGGHHGQRLNKLYKASIKEEEILSILKPLFKKWSLEREDGEHFGDFLIRSKVIKPTLEGKFIHDDVAEDAF
ncbi:LAMI_0C03664g1_1 [Lachancea mirantina]|uniref:assimilatory sulfite reductase (NADPH) n=1 Tax=Lachancea mirantina TaxID=1230905 RepID=A0A1G4J262_9SACH|nr:LAMI_0C03664g1_1 [Lachancea mirantina]